MKAKVAESTTPVSRKGRAINQTNGNRMRATSATGQHNTTKMHQATNNIRTFISVM